MFGVLRGDGLEGGMHTNTEQEEGRITGVWAEFGTNLLSEFEKMYAEAYWDKRESFLISK